MFARCKDGAKEGETAGFICIFEQYAAIDVSTHRLGIRVVPMLADTREADKMGKHTRTHKSDSSPNGIKRAPDRSTGTRKNAC